ncbi:S-adenosyl-L-methionine-dependent methyltransferase [Pyrrhoderma noxium]|uniref:type I protein arginine methyltransferase n=1 Tax=Pyrrhoderma noxium TaxID=2282107 RepID=A0A286UBP8_9AGAM|nr:S-adenosyl-L-methionine-dependent methyltransferase [Pyrrhoderma noxium]
MSVHKLSASTNELEKLQYRHQTHEDIEHGHPPVSDDSSEEDDDDDDWNDWVSDSETQHPCLSLFDGSLHPSVEAVLEYDTEKFNVNINELTSRLSLDFYGRARLVNYIRKEKPSAETINSLKGTEPIFSDDTYLIPAISDDPLLQTGSDDWTDDEEDMEAKTEKDKDRIIRKLTSRYIQAKKDLVDFRQLVVHVKELAQSLQDSDAPVSSLTEVKRDDDTHYFDSYGDNEIHHVMLRDKVRTSTYASFILNSPELFQDAIVLDVGCGTGILSMFAAKAGAKRVFAVDASPNIAEKAQKIVKANGLDDVITVIKGKIEDIELPDGITHVDVIISEWMGYALLYESMLDSVLIARDRFLRPTIGSAPTKIEQDNETSETKEKKGVLVPSQSRMLLGLCSATEIYKDRVEFWSDVYGFDMAPMTEGVYDEAIIDIVGPETVLSESAIVKDINIATITPRQLSFSSPFTIRGTPARRTVAHAFILYFDCFFRADGSQVLTSASAAAVRDGEPVLAEVWRPGSSTSRPASPTRTRSPSTPRSPVRETRLRRASSVKMKAEEGTSFTTGPESLPTHWKQTLFLLKEPIVVSEGTEVSGTFHCRKSEDNSRELDVEIHYVIREQDEEDESKISESPMIIQSFKVR